MTLPFFFEEQLPLNLTFMLSEETSKHAQVLRMKTGDQIKLANGKGKLITAEITTAHKKITGVRVITIEDFHQSDKRVSIAISLIKNSSRFEWFLEKATEIGVSEIIPLICERTEKQYFRFDRMRNILISAMLQSQQAYLPSLHQPVSFAEFVSRPWHQQKYIAHCIQEEKKELSNETFHQNDQLILIGPEGDFTKEEVEIGKINNFIPISLGKTRLRTETAGIVAVVLFNTNLSS